MNLQQFEYVLAVVDLKNFELAAERCHVTQSTLSTMIGRFEREIDIRIFNRKTKPVSITAEGSAIIERLRILHSEVGALKNVIQELKGEQAGELRLGVIPTIAPYVLPLFLTQFAAQFPKVRVVVKEMTTKEIRNGLNRRSVDVGLLALPLGDDALMEHPIYDEPFLVYDCRGGKLSKSIAVEALDYDNLWLLQEGHCLRSQVEQICDLSTTSIERTTNFEFESGSMDSLLRFTKANRGMTIIPHLATTGMSSSDRGRLVKFKEPIPVRTVGLIAHRDFVKKRLLKSLVQCIGDAVNHMLPAVERANSLRPEK